MGRLTDPRLLAIAKMVRPGSVVADIGADHGHLICHLVGNGIAPRGYACDIVEKPLAACAKTVEQCGLEGKIELRLTDGLSGLSLGEIDDIVIAGMGGEMIADIISAAPGAKNEHLRLILQPMTKAERLRERLYRMGFEIERERAVRAGGILYTVMLVRYTGVAKDVGELFAWTGLLPEDASPHSRALLEQTAQRLARAAAGLAQTADGREKAEEYKRLAREIANL